MRYCPIDYKKKKATKRTLAFYDFETLNDVTQFKRACVYNAGLYFEDGSYKNWWGENALKDFMDYVLKSANDGKPLQLVSYNGSGFDGYFLFNYMMQHKDIGSIEHILSNGRLMKLDLDNGTSFFDLYLYTQPMSLEKVFEDCFPNEKMEGKSFFPHQFLKTFADLDYVGAPIKDLQFYPQKCRLNFEENEKFKKFIANLPEIYSLREESDKYLKQDCVVLMRVFKAIEKQFFVDYKVNILDRATLAGTGYALWRSLMTQEKGDLSFISIPNKKTHYDVCLKSVYGGRTQPLKKYFLAKGLSPRLNEMSQEERAEHYKTIKFYLIDGDVVSLYPTAMTSFEGLKFDFPMGDGRFISDEEIQKLQISIDENKSADLPHGIFTVDVTPPDNLINPVLPMKSAKGDNTVWDLIPRSGQCYALPDLVSGMKHGYRFKLTKALVYDQQKASGVFNKYIDLVYKIKAEEDANELEDSNHSKNEEGYVAKYNPTRRMIAKLLMNSLYGKTLQKKIDTATVFIEKDEDMIQFLRDHDWNDLIEMGERIMVVGKKKVFGVCVDKPMQLGSYVLAYSRQIMCTFMDRLDPGRGDVKDLKSFEESFRNTYYYSDTDSMFIPSEIVHRIKDSFYDGNGSKKLGQLDDELKGGKIIEYYGIAPKLYACKILKPNGKITYKIRGKGIMSDTLTWEEFAKLLKGEEVEKKFFMLQRLRTNISKKQRSEGIDEFSIVGDMKSRTLNKTIWGGREVIDGVTLPLGFNTSLLKL